MKYFYYLITFLVTTFAYAAQFGDFTYTDLGNEVEITDYTGTEAGLLVIPSSIGGEPVTTIGDGAFGLSDFTGLTIPSSVQHIKTFAFQGCTSLVELVIPNTVQQIDQGAFFENYELKSIVFEDGGDIQLGNAIFVRCGIGATGSSTIPMEVKLGEGMTQLGSSMFSNCRTLKSITIPDSVTTVGLQTFGGCAGLESVSIGAGLNVISDQMFESCFTLSSVALNSTTTSIGERAFAGCDALTSITIPASVNEMKKEAFQGCDNLKSAVFLGNVPAVFENGDPTFFLFSLQSMFPQAGGSIVGTTVYFLDSSNGFTNGTWEGFPSQELDATNLPPAPWLIANDLPLNADFTTVLNAQGESLLNCYAFNLNPRDAKNSKTINFDDATSGYAVEFYGAAPGVIYEGQSSSSLEAASWTPVGVTLSAPSALGVRTCTIPNSTPRAFLRVEATQNW